MRGIGIGKGLGGGLGGGLGRGLGLHNVLANKYVGGFANKYSLEFDKTNDYLACGALDTYFKNVEKFSISMWVYQEDLTDSGQNGLWGKIRNDHNRIFGYINLDGKIYFGIENGSANTEGGFGKTQSADALSADTWYHIVFVYNGGATGDANRAKVYVNASNKTLDFTDTIPATTSNDATYGTDAFKIGKFQNNDGDIFDGFIDEVGIWDEALDADAVTALYNSGTPFDITKDSGNYDNASDLQVWYRMGDGTEGASGSTIYDMSANSNNATMTNFDGSDFKGSVP